MNVVKVYATLTKPGIIFGNIITAIAGFFLASKGHMQAGLFAATLIGLSLIIGSACVLNNYIDRYSDEKMVRTQNRALVKRLISPQSALIFAMILVLCGILLLTLATNPLTVLMALIGFSIYVGVYSFLKYRSVYGTLIGSIAGAMPPLVGYCAVRGHLDMGGLILWMIVVFWQMPHFYAIAMYRLSDYATASIPVLPVIKGNHVTKIHILFYVIAFAISTVMLMASGYTGYVYLITATSLGLGWLLLCIKGFKIENDQLWARQMFRFSLIVILALSIVISVNTIS